MANTHKIEKCCPFCGEKENIKIDRIGEMGRWVAHCPCGAETDDMYGDWEAEERWNQGKVTLPKPEDRTEF